MSKGDAFIYWGTLVMAWLLLPVAMLCVAIKIAYRYVDKTIEETEA